jgi:hypothetical protein
MKLFRHGYEMTLNRVHDTITVREGSERLTLTVNGDAMRMVAGLNKAQAKMKGVTEATPDEEVKEVAEYFAAVIFGKEQAAKLMAFYAEDPGCVITVCGRYFSERLAGKITEAQKRMKNAEAV